MHYSCTDSKPTWLKPTDTHTKAADIVFTSVYLTPLARQRCSDQTAPSAKACTSFLRPHNAPTTLGPTGSDTLKVHPTRVVARRKGSIPGEGGGLSPPPPPSAAAAVAEPVAA